MKEWLFQICIENLLCAAFQTKKVSQDANVARCIKHAILSPSPGIPSHLAKDMDKSLRHKNQSQRAGVLAETQTRGRTCDMRKWERTFCFREGRPKRSERQGRAEWQQRPGRALVLQSPRTLQKQECQVCDFLNVCCWVVQYVPPSQDLWISVKPSTPQTPDRKKNWGEDGWRFVGGLWQSGGSR